LRGLHAGVPSRRALLAFFRSFSTMVRAGVPLRRGLDVAIERTRDGALREALRGVASEVENGGALGDALARRPRAFPALYVAMVRAGEAGGILDDVLERLAAFLERDDQLRKKLRAALAYPAVVLAGAVVLLVFLVVRIVPMIAELFASFHVDPPATTRALFALAHTLRRPATWIVSATLVAVAASAWAVAARTRRGAIALDRLRLGMPILGPLRTKAIAARLARMLGTLLRAGIDLVTAIEVVRPVAGSARYALALERVVLALREGDPLTTALSDARAFDPLAIALVRVGEETGLVDEMLLTAAAYFETDVDAAVATLGAVLEPLLIGVLGLAVGSIVFSVFIPLYSLIGSVSK
jgi:type IV pilus assembly protein PilC